MQHLCRCVTHSGLHHLQPSVRRISGGESCSKILCTSARFGVAHAIDEHPPIAATASGTEGRPIHRHRHNGAGGKSGEPLVESHAVGSRDRLNTLALQLRGVALRYLSGLHSGAQPRTPLDAQRMHAASTAGDRQGIEARVGGGVIGHPGQTQYRAGRANEDENVEIRQQAIEILGAGQLRQQDSIKRPTIHLDSQLATEEPGRVNHADDRRPRFGRIGIQRALEIRPIGHIRYQQVNAGSGLLQSTYGSDPLTDHRIGSDLVPARTRWQRCSTQQDQASCAARHHGCCNQGTDPAEAAGDQVGTVGAPRDRRTCLLSLIQRTDPKDVTLACTPGDLVLPVRLQQLIHQLASTAVIGVEIDHATPQGGMILGDHSTGPPGRCLLDRHGTQMLVDGLGASGNQPQPGLCGFRQTCESTRASLDRDDGCERGVRGLWRKQHDTLR